MIACRATGTPFLVRIPSGEIGWIKRVLDSGGYTSTSQELRRNQAIRGGLLLPSYRNTWIWASTTTDYGRLGGDEYLEHANREIFVCAQVECKAVVEDLDRIVQIPGLDSLCLGPMDLSGSWQNVRPRSRRIDRDYDS